MIELKMNEEIKIEDTVTPISPSLWLANVPTDGNYYQKRDNVCVFKGKGKVLAIHKVIIDYDEWSKQDRINGVGDFGSIGKLEYKDYFIQCDAGIGWGGGVVKVEEPQTFYDKLWELLASKVGNNTDADELTDRIMDLIKDQKHTDDSFVAAVNDLAARTHKSKAEVLRDAVNLYYKAVNEWGENGRGVVFQPINKKPEPTDEEIGEWGKSTFLPSLSKALSKAEKLSFPITDKDLRIIVRAALAHWK